jgi:hypothetical protein
MSTLLRRDPRAMFPDLVEWFEEPFLTLRPYLAQAIRVEDFVEGGHYLVRAELAGIDPAKDVEVTVGGPAPPARSHQPCRSPAGAQGGPHGRHRAPGPGCEHRSSARGYTRRPR